MIKFLDLQKQYQSIKPEIDQAIADIVNKCEFVGGEAVKNFETNFAAFQNAEHCISVGNGTDALEIALAAFGFDRGSEVLVPANTFFASVEAIVSAGLMPIFCGCRRDDHTLDVQDAAKRITSKTVAIMPVHLYGHPCDMNEILSLASTHGLKVVEDCAQAHAAEYKGRRVGSIGDIGCFSFYPGKNLGAYGDGGAIVTNNGDLAVRCRMIANHGGVSKYDHEFCGRNSRLDGIQASVLNVKLKHLPNWTETRIQVAKAYDDALAGVDGIEVPLRQNWARHVYHLYVIRVGDRDGLKVKLAERDIQTGIHYPIALPSLAAFADHPQANADMFACEQDKHLLSLPMGDHLSTQDALEVAAAINT